jgi:membrane associated rhomboid family serine protease
MLHEAWGDEHARNRRTSSWVPRSPRSIAGGIIVPFPMIPLGDSEATRRLSPANTILIAGNIAIFGLELYDDSVLPLTWFALVPARISHLQWTRPGAGAAALATLISSLFVHAGVLHLAGNMLYLLVFGPAVEGRLGHARFIVFYLAAGIVACLAMVAMAPQSPVPVIGASGAIAGVLGGYFVLYPRGRIRTLLPASFMLRWIEIPAILYLLVWFGLQLVWGISSDPSGPLLGGVAWWAHVGGFLFGVAAAPLIAGQPVKRRQISAKAKLAKRSG